MSRLKLIKTVKRVHCQRCGGVREFLFEERDAFDPEGEFTPVYHSVESIKKIVMTIDGKKYSTFDLEKIKEQITPFYCQCSTEDIL